MGKSKNEYSELITKDVEQRLGDGGAAYRNVDLEKTILGACLLEIEYFDLAKGCLHGDDFTEDAHQFVWRTLHDMLAEGIRPDRTALVAFLQRQGKAKKVNPKSLDEMVKLATIRPIDMAATARLLQQQTIARKLFVLSQDIQRKASKGENAEALLGHAEQFLDRLRGEATVSGKEDLLTIEETIDSLPGGFEDFVDPYRNSKGVKTRFAKLNDFIAGGFHDGELVLVGARPKVGKSLLACEFAMDAAAMNVPTVYFSLEMKREQVFRRMAAQMANVRLADMRAGSVSAPERERIKAARDRLNDMPLWVTHKSGRTLMNLRSKLRQWKSKHGRIFAIVDYLQLMTAEGRQSMLEKISDLTRGLKETANDLDIPLIAIVALNRAPEQRSGDEKRPTMADIKYAGEYDADLILLLHRQGAYLPVGHPKRTNESVLIVGGQRDGATGDVPLKFREDILGFYDPNPQDDKIAPAAVKQQALAEDDETPW